MPVVCIIENIIDIIRILAVEFLSRLKAERHS